MWPIHMTESLPILRYWELFSYSYGGSIQIPHVVWLPKTSI